jgi:hypothetical protein
MLHLINKLLMMLSSNDKKEGKRKQIRVKESNNSMMMTKMEESRASSYRKVRSPEERVEREENFWIPTSFCV